MQVITELKNRGVSDVFIACVDGLKGFPEAIEAVFPQTTGAALQGASGQAFTKLRVTQGSEGCRRWLEGGLSSDDG
jgi:hypothetical protein